MIWYFAIGLRPNHILRRKLIGNELFYLKNRYEMNSIEWRLGGLSRHSFLFLTSVQKIFFNETHTQTNSETTLRTFRCCQRGDVFTYCSPVPRAHTFWNAAIAWATAAVTPWPPYARYSSRCLPSFTEFYLFFLTQPKSIVVPWILLRALNIFVSPARSLVGLMHSLFGLRFYRVLLGFTGSFA